MNVTVIHVIARRPAGRRGNLDYLAVLDTGYWSLVTGHVREAD